MKTYTFNQAKNNLIGKVRTIERDQYEFELKLELIGIMIQQARKQRNLSQHQLGELIGVKKSQISRLENKTGNVTIETILKVFDALEAKVNFNVQMLDQQVKLV